MLSVVVGEHCGHCVWGGATLNHRGSGGWKSKIQYWCPLGFCQGFFVLWWGDIPWLDHEHVFSCVSSYRAEWQSPAVTCCL